MSRTNSANRLKSASNNPLERFVSFTHGSQISDRPQRYGIECAEELVWRKWSVGGEYVKKLIVKNVTSRTLEFTYRLPKSRNFFMNFAEWSKLSPGVSTALDVSFRPLENVDYEDSITIVTKSGEFQVVVKAFLPVISVKFPDEMNLGYCPTKEVSYRSFVLENDGGMSFEYEWIVETPFSIKPRRGSLTPSTRVETTIFFEPQEACVLVSTAVLKLSTGEHKVMTLNAIGKYAFISTNNTQLEFGEVMITKKLEQSFTIENKSLVRASYNIQQIDPHVAQNHYELSDLQKIFTFNPSKGVIPPGKSHVVNVTYTPIATGSFDCNHYEIMTPGGNTVKFSCVGSGRAPDLELSTNSLNFGDVPIGPESCSKRLLTITNKSNIPAEYNLQTEVNGSFEFSQIAGIIPALSSRQISVCFSPTNPINYYKRVYILIGSHNIALYVDILGTGYTLQKRPAPFTQKHVNMYRMRARMGLQSTAIEEIEELLDIHETNRVESITHDETKVSKLNNLVKTLKVLDPRTRSEEPSFSSLSFDGADSMHEFFLPVTSTSNAVSIDHVAITFGSCSRFRMIEYKTVNIRNHTDGKITCEVIVPGKGMLHTDEVPFVVYPDTADIPAHGVQSFRIAFRPTKDNMMYSTQVEFACYFKAMRSFRLVTDKTFTPPWFVELRVSGNTFPETDSFIPRAVLTPASTIAFSPCLFGDVAYRTIMIQNEDDVPLLFDFMIDTPNSDSSDLLVTPQFQCKPKSGCVPKNSFQLISFKFSPVLPARSKEKQIVFNQTVKCIFNESMNHIVPLTVVGLGFAPTLEIENEGKLYFKPTHANTTSVKEIRVHNPARVDITYHWDISNQMSEIFSVDNRSGVLKGNEKMTLKWAFHPKKKQQYITKIPCIVSSLSQMTKTTAFKERVYLSLAGEGTTGGLAIEPSYIDYGTILISNTESRHLTIFNSSECAIPYHLVIVEVVDGKIDSAIPTEKLKCLKEGQGSIAARAHKVVDLYYSPNDHTIDKFLVFCVVESNATSGRLSVDQLYEFPYCEVKAMGAYPLIGITDVQSEGYSKSDLWKQFSIGGLNEELSSSSDMSTENRFLFDFGAKVIDSPDMVVYIRISNLGKLPVDVTIAFPYDSMSTLENWFQNRVPHTQEEEKELEIVTNNLFEVFPKKLHLEEGQSSVVTAVYHHVIADCHTIPVELQVQYGKKLTIDFTGQTLQINQKLLHFTSFEHEFESVDIGSMDRAPIQYYSLRNSCEDNLTFNVDTEPLEKLKADNYGVEILQLENPTGSIEGNNSTAVLRFIFSPLEIKTYEVELPIRVRAEHPGTANSVMSAIVHPESDIVYYVTFRGKGMNRADLESQEQENDNEHLSSYIPREVPAIQRLSDVPNQLSAVSMEVLTLGDIPALSVNRRMIVLKNMSSSDVNFQWLCDLPKDNLDLSMKAEAEPEKGILKPGERALVKIVFTAGSLPQIMDCDIVCRVYNETQQKIKEKKRHVFEESLLTPKPTIEEVPLVDNLNTSKGFDKVQRESVLNKTTTARMRSLRTPFTESFVRRADILAISRTGLTTGTTVRDGLMSSQSRKAHSALSSKATTSLSPNGIYTIEEEESDDEFGIKEVKVFKHYIRVRAVVLTLEDYKAKYENTLWKKSYIPSLAEHNYQVLVDDRAGSAAPRLIKTPRPVTPPVKNLLRSSDADIGKSLFSGVLSSILQEVVNDNKVSQALFNFNDAPIPYYCDFSRSIPRVGSQASDSNQTRVLLKPDFQQSVEWVLDETAFNIVGEIFYGDFDLMSNEEE